MLKKIKIKHSSILAINDIKIKFKSSAQNCVINPQPIAPTAKPKFGPALLIDVAIPFNFSGSLSIINAITLLEARPHDKPCTNLPKNKNSVLFINTNDKQPNIPKNNTI